MSAGPVARTVRGGLTRRRVQVVVIGVVLLVSTAASVTALALVADSSSPFDHAFAAQRGAQVAMAVNSVKAADAQLAATRRLPGVTAAAGPFGEVTSTPRITGPSGGQLTLPPVTLAGRASQGGRSTTSSCSRATGLPGPARSSWLLAARTASKSGCRSAPGSPCPACEATGR